ncbi:MAG TPA: PKD domain-containing protein, partial [Bacteroidales bacterium]|nr:PKD domain-containing protein [Bacteroidales bacterium]
MRNKLLLILFSALACFMLQGNTATAARSPLVDFTYAGICVNSETTFTVDAGVTNVNDVVIWDWSFGDGDFSNIKNPVHTYAGAGDYPVTLTITDKFGGVGTVTRTVSIKK